MKSVNSINKPINQPITTPILLLVEGDDEEHLIGWMAQHWFRERAQAIGIENVKGKDQFPARFDALAVRSLGALQQIGVIADSEESAADTAKAWHGRFEKLKARQIQIPCHLLQLPSPAQNGAFEELVLQALDQDVIARCAMQFRDCVANELSDRTQAQKDKVAVQAWLSARMGKAYGNVFSAQKAYDPKTLLNYDHPAFVPIRDFLQTLLDALT